jgi:hypothetical protein
MVPLNDLDTSIVSDAIDSATIDGTKSINADDIFN